MTDKQALIALAERCESATGADRELDGEITSLIFGAEVQKVTIGPDHRSEEVVTIDRSSAAPVSRPVAKFTASLDDALSLVPEGCAYLLSSINPDEEREDGRLWALVGDPESTSDACGAATPALALCAAALRAKAAQ